MISTVRITKEFSFEMAHALYGHDGLCRNIHGHSYHLSVTVKGKPVHDNSEKKNGMLLDFGDLKTIVRQSIIDEFDHALVLNAGSPHKKEYKKLAGFSEKIVLFPTQPTCENMVVYFAEKLSKRLPDNIKLHCLKLRETSSTYAEWYAEDN